MMIRGKCEGMLIEEEDGTSNYIKGGKVCALGAIALANGWPEEELFEDEDYDIPGAREYGEYLITDCVAEVPNGDPLTAIFRHNDGMPSTAEEVADLMRSCAK